LRCYDGAITFWRSVLRVRCFQSLVEAPLKAQKRIVDGRDAFELFADYVAAP
jgi:hypothetical protein